MQTAIDELNKPVDSAEFYADYFGVMELPEKEIEDRIELANKFETVFYFILALILADSNNNELQSNEYYTFLLFNRYRDVVSNFYKKEIADDDYIYELAQRQSKVIVDETILKISDDYYSSETRAINISAEETNSVANYNMHLENVKNGKQHKRIKCRMDGKERKEHRLANGQVKPINEPFIVGGEKMMFMRDRSLGASDKNIIGCRCTTEYF